MGCGQSKIEHEEAVTRCKDRKLYMKEAVSYRNAFAAAHSAYAMSLKNTGAALSDFAHGEVINPNFLPTPTIQSLPTATSAAVAAPQPPPHPDILSPPPPPPPHASPFPPPPPLLRAVSMPEMKIPIKPDNSGHVAMGPTIPEEEDDDDDDDEMEIEKREKLVTRKRGTSGGGSSSSSRRDVENNHPPPPVVASPPLPASMQGAHDSRWAEYSDYIFQPQESMMGPGLTAVVEEEEEVVVVNDHKVFDERPKRVDNVEDVRKSAKAVVVEEEPPPPPEKVAAMVVDNTPVLVVGSGNGGGGGGGGSMVKSSKKVKGGGGERRVAKAASVSLLQIFVDLDDHFLKASESAHEVSKMLEATRLHYHSNFADNRGNDLLIYKLE